MAMQSIKTNDGATISVDAGTSREKTKMKHATMCINPGVEVNLARQELQRYMSANEAKLYIPDEGGYISNLFNNERGRNLDTWIEAIYAAIHENRERHREHERQQSARQRGMQLCEHCGAAFKKPLTRRGYTSLGNPDTFSVCPQCGRQVE